MKAVWKGHLKCGLVLIPIKMYHAISQKSIHFNLLHKDCLGKVKLEKVCSKCGKRLSPEEIVKGYPYGKDRYIIVTDEDIEKAKRESTDFIEIIQFVDDSEIHPIYYSNSHYLAPDGEAGFEAFALFHQAMIETKKAALAKIVMRNREYLLALKPYNGTMIAFTLYYHQEIKNLKEIEDIEKIKKIQIDQKALNMAKILIDNLSGNFEPEKYCDEYTETLMAIIKAKAEGEEIKVSPKVEKEKVISLMDALQRSIEEVAEVPKKKMAVAGKKTKAKKVRKKA